MKSMFTLCLALLLTGITQAQETFKLNIKLKSDANYSRALIPAGDGGTFIIGAGPKDCSGCGSRVFAQHYSAQGKLLWAQTYAANTSTLRPQAVATSDGGFLFFTRLEDPSVQKGQGALLVKCDLQGKVVWKKQLLSKTYTAFEPLLVREDNDGNILLFYTVSDVVNAGVYNSGVLQVSKLNTSGKTIWCQTGQFVTLVSPEFYAKGFKQIGKRYYILGANFSERLDGLGTASVLVLDTSGRVTSTREISQDPLFSQESTTADGLYVRKGKVYLTGTSIDYDVPGPELKRYLLALDDTSARTATGIAFGTDPASLKYQLRNLSVTYPFQVDEFTYYTTQQTLVQLSGFYTLSRYDSLNRICPKYAQPTVDTTTRQQSFTISNLEFNKRADTVFSADIAVSVKNDSITYSIVCSGIAPQADKLFPAITLVKNEGLQFYPNPVRDAMQISGIKTGSEVLIYDAVGSEVKRVVATGERMAVKMNELTSGVYFVKVRKKGMIIYSGKMVKE